MLIAVSMDARKEGHFPPDLSKWGNGGGGAFFITASQSNFMVYQVRIKVIFLQYSCFYYFEVNIVGEQK